MVSFARSSGGVLSVSFFSVGQGDSIYIEGPNGTQVLIDGGPDKIVLSRLGDTMSFYDRSIDAVIATHPDKDHIAGLVDVLERYDISYFFEPGIGSDTAVYAALENIVAEKKIPKIFPRRGMKLELGGGAELEILFPDRNVVEGETNTMSIIASVRYGETCFLLTGDAPKQIERYLVALGEEKIRCDVLKAGHHGSRTSTSAEFLAAVAPTFGVISAGANNRYGHPHAEVLKSFSDAGVEILDTMEGPIRFISDGKTLRRLE